MSAILGESLLYEAARVLHGNRSVSYYQYKALCAFVETVVLHDRAILFSGEETDEGFLRYFDSLIDYLQKRSDFHIDIVSPKTRSSYIGTAEMKRFEMICREVYRHPLGVNSDDLFIKQRKDRTSEDMSERIERIFCGSLPEIDARRITEDIYTTYLTNANSSELMYFFRAHLLQAMAEVQGLTPIFENQRLLAYILQEKTRKENKVGTLAFGIYRMVDSLFVEACDLLPHKQSYPRASIFLYTLVGSINRRSDILQAIVDLRDEFREFRQHYKNIETVLMNDDASLQDRLQLKEQLEDALTKVWVPTVTSFGTQYSSNALIKAGKSLFGKYGIGDLKFARSEKATSSEESISYSTPSLIGIGTALVKTVSDVTKDAKLYKPNKALLDTLLRVVKLTDVGHGLLRYLPVRDFNYGVNQFIDSALAGAMKGASA